MRIIDAFLYNGEPVVDLRLNYLKNTIDHFYIFESAVAQNGIYKPLYGPALLEKFSDLKDKITYVNLDKIADLKPMSQEIYTYLATQDPVKAMHIFRKYCLARESICRTAMQRYLHQTLQDDDIIYFADSDEIPLHETIHYVRQYYKKLDFPLPVLGELIDGDILSKNALLEIFWYEAFFIKQTQLTPDINLEEIRFEHHWGHAENFVPEDYNILIKTPKNGIHIKPYGLKIDRYRKDTLDGHIYAPLMFHFRDFFDASGLYKKHLHSSYYPKKSLDVADLKDYLLGDYDYYKNRIYFLYKDHNFNKKYHHNDAYFKSILPQEMIDFHYMMAEKRSIIPNDTVLEQQYHALYDPFIGELTRVMNKEKP